MQERRKFPRFACPKDKSCTIVGIKEEGFSGELKNISRDGALIVSKNRLEDNSRLDAVIKYPTIDRDIPSVIQIVWSRSHLGKYIYGGKLVSISNEDKYDLLDHFYESWKNGVLNRRRWLPTA
jgi:hypothetical protein